VQNHNQRTGRHKEKKKKDEKRPAFVVEKESRVDKKEKKKKISKKERALDRRQLDFILSINCPYSQGKELSNHIHK
jgi:hypothetical protein